MEQHLGLSLHGSFVRREGVSVPVLCVHLEKDKRCVPLTVEFGLGPVFSCDPKTSPRLCIASPLTHYHALIVCCTSLHLMYALIVRCIFVVGGEWVNLVIDILFIFLLINVLIVSRFG